MKVKPNPKVSKTLSLIDKREILKRLASGGTVKKLAAKYNVSLSTIQEIKKKSKEPYVHTFESTLVRWYREKNINGNDVTDEELRQEALKYFQIFRPEAPSGSFKASDPWIQGFKKRHKLEDKIVNSSSKISNVLPVVRIVSTQPKSKTNAAPLSLLKSRKEAISMRKLTGEINQGLKEEKMTKNSPQGRKRRAPAIGKNNESISTKRIAAKSTPKNETTRNSKTSKRSSTRIQPSETTRRTRNTTGRDKQAEFFVLEDSPKKKNKKRHFSISIPDKFNSNKALQIFEEIVQGMEELHQRVETIEHSINERMDHLEDILKILKPSDLEIKTRQV